jgi:hypothetical protein
VPQICSHAGSVPEKVQLILWSSHTIAVSTSSNAATAAQSVAGEDKKRFKKRRVLPVSEELWAWISV